MTHACTHQRGRPGNEASTHTDLRGMFQESLSEAGHAGLDVGERVSSAGATHPVQVLGRRGRSVLQQQVELSHRVGGI